MVETYSQIYTYFHGNHSTINISLRYRLPMLYNEKEKLGNKENKLFSWETSRKVTSLLGNVETISPSSLPSRKRKNRGIPFWQDQEEITGFLLPDKNM